METITLTLNLHRHVAMKVLTFLDTLSDSHISSVRDEFKLNSEILAEQIKPATEAPTVLPTAGKITKMPSFGRHQDVIDQFTKAESERISQLDEDTELKLQRKEERELRQTEKALEAQEVKAEKLRKDAEVTAIKEEAASVTTTTLPKKPWSL